MKRRKKGISPEDYHLWAEVAKSAKPLPGRAHPGLPIVEAQNPAPSPSLPLPLTTPPVPKPRPLPPLFGLDRRMRRDVRRGQREIDARIDLHGMRQAEAHQALLTFLHQAHHRGAKLTLVITGKGGGVDGLGEERGVLRRMVPHWLADPGLRRLVIGYEAASPGHGGEGALYVRIRRER